jgi:hypothetical protein
MQISRLAASLAVFVSFGAMAQLVELDPDWKEVDVPPPPAFNRDRLVPVDMPPHITLKLGIDPATLTISSDSVVRYVMVATSGSGSVNAMYEGIRCMTGEVKVYARYSSSGQWKPVDNAQWRPLNDNQPSKHALAFARQGACDGVAPTSMSPTVIIQKLKSPPAQLR